ncbi:hypothetical protein IscW_ISCW006535 [Ixodes scapularis]|uniref:Uncharacterized protein n=1 Tax=Ixodes scapularis TaxID=6945 RepID=B7PQC3_IXOSC|nr:hypothetical protein IscW_ISCW006535 [Ixodes scapularis]|eukprot:XP_002435965.1 hypothetical protein IscW_ISCW006535 [Ixodes scapularis]
MTYLSLPVCVVVRSESSDWFGVREFLTVNDHLAGPVSHGDCGPKTELESLVDAAIAEGDLDRAEMLSNHLADRQVIMNQAAEPFHCSSVGRRQRRLVLSWPLLSGSKGSPD